MLSKSKALFRRSFSKAIPISITVAALAALILLIKSGPPAGASARSSTEKPSVADYKTLPVYFEQNRGQTDSRVRFLSRGPGYTVFLTAEGAVMALRKADVPAGSAKTAGRASAATAPTITTASVWLKLAGARPDAQMDGVDALPGRVNYFIGNDQRKWHSDIPTFARVRYRSVYPGIDLVYHGAPQALEYDLIAAPGADPGQIRIELQGADKTRIDAAGNLVIGTAAGDLTMRKPLVYQDDAAGTRRTIEASYRVTAAAKEHGMRMVAVQVARHDPHLALVIDPEIVYSTYLGGKGDRSGQIQGFQVLPPLLTSSLNFSDVAIDLSLGPNNTAFVTGLAYSSNFPTTAGVLQPTDQSTSTTPNAFVAKFDTTKSGAASLVYSTYLGGSGCNSAACAPGADGDQANGIAADLTGDAYVAGLTYSPNFPNSCGAFGIKNNQGAANINNGFVAELNPTGSKLVYSCFIHGSNGAPAASLAMLVELQGLRGRQHHVAGQNTGGRC